MKKKEEKVIEFVAQVTINSQKKKEEKRLTLTLLPK